VIEDTEDPRGQRNPKRGNMTPLYSTWQRDVLELRATSPNIKVKTLGNPKEHQS
jgi:hypothetical protein